MTNINKLCCYDGGRRPATETDYEGDDACAICAAREGRAYEVVTRFDGEWVDSALAKKVSDALLADGWRVTIREPRKGEAQATYERRGSGLQILGYSIPQPDALIDAIDAAWNANV